MEKVLPIKEIQLLVYLERLSKNVLELIVNLDKSIRKIKVSWNWLIDEMEYKHGPSICAWDVKEEFRMLF